MKDIFLVLQLLFVLHNADEEYFSCFKTTICPSKTRMNTFFGLAQIFNNPLHDGKRTIFRKVCLAQFR